MPQLDSLSSDLPEVAPDDERVQWEVLEIIAVIVLVAIGILVVGGLLGALIFANSDEIPGGFTTQATWNAVSRGAAWSGPLTSMILLGLMGVAWFQARPWAVHASAHSDRATVSAHLHRAVRIAGWTLAGLVLSFFGAVASLVSVIGFNWSNNSASFVASLAIPLGASALAVLLLAGAGTWIYIQTRHIAQAT